MNRNPKGKPQPQTTHRKGGVCGLGLAENRTPGRGLDAVWCVVVVWAKQPVNTGRTGTRHPKPDYGHSIGTTALKRGGRGLHGLGASAPTTLCSGTTPDLRK